MQYNPVQTNQVLSLVKDVGVMPKTGETDGKEITHGVFQKRLEFGIIMMAGFPKTAIC